MAKHYRHKIAGMICIAICLVVTTAFGEGLPSPAEMKLITLINQARVNPLATAEKYGLNRSDVLAGLPELREILENGLPPLHYNQELSNIAMLHTLDMLDRAYYAKTSPEGETYEDRIGSGRYLPSVSGESLGMLGFINYLDPASAVEQIFRNMFLGELDADRTEQRNILNQDLEDIGVALGSGRRSVGSAVYNIYITTCDFAARRMTESDLELLALVNQARSFPLDVAMTYGLSLDELVQVFPGGADTLMNGMTPLAMDNMLYVSADSHLGDMLERQYFSTVSPEGKTPSDRISETGYNPELSGEVIGSLLSDDTMDEKEAASVIISRRLREEFESDERIERRLLNPSFEDIGVAFRKKSMGNSDLVEQSQYHLLVADLGMGVEKKTPQLMVHGYVDVNENGVFDMGEGKEGISFILTDADGESLSADTGKGGYFGLELENGIYRISLNSEVEDGDFADISIEDGNKVVFIMEDADGQRYLDTR